MFFRATFFVILLLVALPCGCRGVLGLSDRLMDTSEEGNVALGRELLSFAALLTLGGVIVLVHRGGAAGDNDESS